MDITWVSKQLPCFPYVSFVSTMLLIIYVIHKHIYSKNQNFTITVLKIFKILFVNVVNAKVVYILCENDHRLLSLFVNLMPFLVYFFDEIILNLTATHANKKLAKTKVRKEQVKQQIESFIQSRV